MELSSLKNQFNSHITFNFLNYCFSRIHQRLPKTAESIGLFSDMLRYSLQVKPEVKVSLTDEIRNIENYINLQMQLNKEVNATFKYNGEIGGRTILPCILIVFVENAFKQGRHNNPCTWIHVNLNLENDKLYFSVTSKVDPDKILTNINKELNNVIQILDLYYKDKYKLKQEEKDGLYTIDLCMTGGTINEDAAQPDIMQKSVVEVSVIGSKSTLGYIGARLKPLMHLNKKQIQRHILIWVLIIIHLEIMSPLNAPWPAKIIGSALIDINFMFAFYSLSLFVFPMFWEGKSIFLFISILLCLLLYWVGYHITCLNIIPALGGSIRYQNKTLFYFLKATFYFFVISGSAGTASFFSRYGLYKIKQQADIEKSLIVKELNYLKNQFNSDITFNFLNYCYNKTLSYSLEVASSIELFSDMLRYTIQSRAEEKVALESEIRYLENFISLQKLLSARVFADFGCKGDTAGKYILPRILITFVENAFKHGMYNDSGHPISISLQVENNKLIFNIENKVRLKKTFVGSSTGLENVTQILDLYYHDNHELICTKNDEFYRVTLTLNFQKT